MPSKTPSDEWLVTVGTLFAIDGLYVTWAGPLTFLSQRMRLVLPQHSAVECCLFLDLEARERHSQRARAAGVSSAAQREETVR